MKYTTKKCPNCGNTYAWLEPKYMVNYGSPIRYCAKCGTRFIDRDYKEIAIDGFRKTFIAKVRPFSIICTIVGLGLFAMEIFYFGGSDLAIFSYIFGGLFILTGVISIIGDIKDHEERKKEFERLKRESEERLSDPEYAQLLKDLGFYVPPQFLPPPVIFYK